MRTIAGLGRLVRCGLATLADARVGGVLALAILASSIFVGTSAPLARLDRIGGVELRTADFVAFYCGGAVAGRSDPYRTDALAPCERRFHGVRSVLPAPLPPYDLVALHALARLEPARARYVWFGILIAAFVGAAALLQPVAGVPWAVVLAAFAVGTGRDDLYLAQVVPLVVLAIGGSSWCLRRGMPERAGLCALLALAEPHLGLPAIVALVAWVPRSRAVVAGGLAVLAAVSIAAFGWSRCHDYATVVLPLHALAEASFRYQYSLTYLLSAGGLAAREAVYYGTLSFAVMLIAGVLLAGPAARRTASPELVVLVPAAFVLVGGAFVKQQQLVVAVPLCFALVRLTAGRARWYALATFFLATLAWEPEPFDGAGWDAATGALAIAVAAATARGSGRRSVALAAAAATAAFALVSALAHGTAGALAVGIASSSSPASSIAVDHGFASYAWAVELRADGMRHPLTLGLAVAKALTWAGLLAMVAMAIRVVHAARPRALGAATARRPAASGNVGGRLVSRFALPYRALAYGRHPSPGEKR